MIFFYVQVVSALSQESYYLESWAEIVKKKKMQELNGMHHHPKSFVIDRDDPWLRAMKSQAEPDLLIS